MLKDLYEKLSKSKNVVAANKVWSAPKIEDFHVPEFWQKTHAENFSNIHPLEFDALIQHISRTDNKLVVEQFKRLLSTAKLTMGDGLERIHKVIRETEERNAEIRKYYEERLRAYGAARVEYNECDAKFTLYWAALVSSIQLKIVQPGVSQIDYDNLLEYIRVKNIPVSKLTFFKHTDVEKFLHWVFEKKKPKPPPMQKYPTVPVKEIGWWTAATKRIFDRHARAGKTD